MDLLIRFLILSVGYFIVLRPTNADTYNVKIGTEHHVNVVDNKFLSFTVDPKYLFASSEKYYRFVQWARAADFQLVFALNPDVKTAGGLWDPNAAISILTVADHANVTDIYWQLGYECNNQTIEEYLNDLQTLRVITETFPDRERWRVVAGDVTPCLGARSKSDFKDYVTLSEDLLDAVLLNGNSSAQELERMSDSDRLKLLKLLSVSETPLWLTESTSYHAQFAQDLDKSAQEISAQKKGAQEKNAQLSESARHIVELRRAADWMSSLGYSARNGFAVHFRELVEDELFEPSLSFYMALLYKNLVGERVLNVSMEASEAVLFAHCTSLRRKPIPGAVTLFGANMDSEPARMAVKLSQREEGGDIMQFILGHDVNGNIVVNGRAMYHEGDIRPVVKRVRPYKTLLLNLPPKTFGFWVLANTNIGACQEVEDGHEKEFVEAITVLDESKEETNKIMTKRSMLQHNREVRKNKNVSNENKDVIKTSDRVKSLKDRVRNMNKDLNKVKGLFKRESKANTDKSHNRIKRQLNEEENETEIKRKLKRHGLKSRIERNRVADEDEKPLDFIRKLINPKLHGSKHLRHEKSRKLLRLAKNRLSKRNSKHYKEKQIDSEAFDDNTPPLVEGKTMERRRRSILDEKHNKEPSNHNIQHLQQRLDAADSKENDISTEQAKLWKILRKVNKQLDNLAEKSKKIGGEETDSEDEFVVTTKLLDNGATLKYKENEDNGLVKSTIGNLMSVIKDLNKNLNKMFRVVSILD